MFLTHSGDLSTLYGVLLGRIRLFSGVWQYSNLDVHLPPLPMSIPLADDPYWWSDEERRLVHGTRLGRAIEQYQPGLKQLCSWSKRLEELHR